MLGWSRSYKHLLVHIILRVPWHALVEPSDFGQGVFSSFLKSPICVLENKDTFGIRANTIKAISSPKAKWECFSPSRAPACDDRKETEPTRSGKVKASLVLLVPSGLWRSSSGSSAVSMQKSTHAPFSTPPPQPTHSPSRSPLGLLFNFSHGLWPTFKDLPAIPWSSVPGFRPSVGREPMWGTALPFPGYH